MSYNVNCVTCQLVGKKEIKEFPNRNGGKTRVMNIETKVPRKDPSDTSASTGYDYVNFQVLNEMVDDISRLELFSWINLDFVFRTHTTKEGKMFSNLNVTGFKVTTI